MPARRDIALQRNEDLVETWVLTDGAGPIDLTGCTLACHVRAPLDNAALVEAATIAITNASAGEFAITLRASEGSALASYGNPIQAANLPYDVRLTYSDGIQLALVTGTIILSRGKTHL